MDLVNQILSQLNYHSGQGVHLESFILLYKSTDLIHLESNVGELSHFSGYAGGLYPTTSKSYFTLYLTRETFGDFLTARIISLSKSSATILPLMLL